MEFYFNYDNKFCMLEVWKNINEEYEVSNLGRVKTLSRSVVRKDGRIMRLESKFLSTYIHKKGYEFVKIRRKNCSVHRLVASAFLDKMFGRTDVNHINCDKKDNRVENLEWCTKSENMQHAIANDRIVRKYGKENHFSVKILQLTMDGVLVKEWDSISDVKRDLGLDTKSLIYCCQGKMYKTVGGFKWKYSEIEKI